VKVDCKKVDLEKIGAFPKFFLDYINKIDSLKPFYGAYPEIANFREIIDKKTFTGSKREKLVAELEKQYEGLSFKPDLDILLKENTFTVTTGHQLNIFTGPLYIIFKIVTAINLAKKLKNTYPNYNFVPVYWMASEDHDLEEIQSFRAFGRKYKWKTDQTGAVGRMKPDGLAEIGDQLGKEASFFKDAYAKNSTLANAVRDYMHHLFGTYGLVTIDADSRLLKSQFQSVMKDDLLNNTAYGLVNERTSQIENLGYKTQISPREINFFYLDKNLRERIVKTESGFEVLHTDLTFSQSQMEDIIINEPEKLSPNVVLRPLYEEWILPNLAYIGGPSEVPYWLQLKPVFEHYKEAFPALLPRNFGLILDAKSKENLDKLNFSLEDIFKPTDDLKKEYVKANSQMELDLNKELDVLNEIYSSIKQKADSLDITLGRTTEAFETKSIDLIKKLEKRLIRAEKRNHSEAMTKIEQIREHLCPGGGLQERKDNMLNFYSLDNLFIEQLLEAFDPLNYSFNVILP
jgi:bacillithiol biosynthesis cysteine-adding enzyme BshC